MAALTESGIKNHLKCPPSECMQSNGGRNSGSPLSLGPRQLIPLSTLVSRPVYTLQVYICLYLSMPAVTLCLPAVCCVYEAHGCPWHPLPEAFTLPPWDSPPIIHTAALPCNSLTIHGYIYHPYGQLRLWITCCK